MHEVWIEEEAVLLSPILKNVIQNVVEKVLEQQGITMDTTLYVIITDDKDIQTLNREHRGIDASTDVLSFPLLSYTVPGNIEAEPGDYENGRLVLGDIVVSDEHARRQAQEYGHSIEREYGFLVAHSTLHLLGYDHETEPERAVMREKEEKALTALQLTR